MAVVEHPLGGLIEGMLQGHQLAQQLHRQMQEDQAFKTNQALHEQNLSMQDIMNRQILSRDYRKVSDLGMIDNPELQAPAGALPAVTPGGPIAGTALSRKADSSRTVKYGGGQYERKTDEELQQRDLDEKVKSSDALEMAKGESAQRVRQSVLKMRGVPIPADVATPLRMAPGTLVLPEEIPALAQHAQAIIKGGFEKIGAEDTLVNLFPGNTPGAAAAPGGNSGPDMPGIDTPGVESWLPGNSVAPGGGSGSPAAAVAPGAPAATPSGPQVVARGSGPKPTGDLERSWLPAFALKHGLTPEGLRKPENAALMMQGVTEYAQRTQDPAAKQMMQQLHQATLALSQERLAALQASRTTTPMQINPGTREFRIAQDLAYGKLTFAGFRSLIGGRTEAATNKKLDIYDKAAELNPNFNMARFEMGFTLAKNPKVQQQLASMDNVTAGIDDLLKFSDAASRSGVTTLNKFIVPGGFALGGKKYSDFKTAQIGFADELSGALGFGSATDMSRQMGIDMTNTNLSPENFRSAVENVVKPFIERKRSTLLKQMGVYGEEGMNPAAPAKTAEAAAGGGTVQYTVNGQTYAIPAADEAEFLKDHPKAVKK